MTDRPTAFLALQVTRDNQGFSATYLTGSDGEREGTVHADSLAQLSDALQSFVDPGWAVRHRGLLLLDANSITEALEFAWETTLWAGQRLGEQAVIVRAHRWTAVPEHQQRGSIRWLNLFPREEYRFDELQPWITCGSLRPAEGIGMGRDWRDCIEAFVLAHGDARGILNREGFPVHWPVHLPAPRRLWLLACAEGDAMARLSQQFLAAGTETVVCATGRLDAHKIAGVVRARLQALDQDPDAPVAHALLSLVSEAGSSEAGGVATLTVWGEVPIDTGAGAHWNQAHWARWSGRRPSHALDDRSTAADLASVLSCWRSGRLWPVTQRALYPALVWRAERHDHNAMLELLSQVPIDREPGPLDLRARATEARRMGDYMRAMASVCTALDQSLDMVIRKDLLLLRANILIDMNLPGAAQRDLHQHEACGDQPENEMTRTADEAKRLDGLARSWMRCGQPERARDKLERKLTLSATGALGGDHSRVQTSLLYQLSWSLMRADHGWEERRKRVLYLSQWAAQKLSSVCATDTPAANDDSLYLARALAAYAWSTQDHAVAQLLTPWRENARNRFGDIDPGPWSYLILFGYLMASPDVAYADKADYGRAQDALKEARYDLESAAFAALAGDDVTRDAAYERFVMRRDRVLHFFDDAATLAEAEQRGATEKDALRAPLSSSAEFLMATGAMPL